MYEQAACSKPKRRSRSPAPRKLPLKSAPSNFQVGRKAATCRGQGTVWSQYVKMLNNVCYGAAVRHKSQCFLCVSEALASPQGLEKP